ncbi:MAG: GNAT family N-acetyltransferase [Propionibacteriaceae bacterium]|jgi:predicted acetyltransferase|nr:GNAT family N-acetyltransferase [Propionibacteriaceae bacterium]
MDWKLVAVGPDRAAEVVDLTLWAFVEADIPDYAEHVAETLDWERSFGVEVDGRLVAFSSAWHFDLPVPGGVLPTGGLTWVGVHPGFRRRGMLRTMLARHFEDCRARGESASILTAAEVPIYTRFGYGQADRTVRTVLPRKVALRDVPGAEAVSITLERADPAKHAEATALVHRQHVGRPLFVPAGADGPWSARFHDPQQWRDGAEPLRVAVARRDGRPTGFAFFRRKEHWTPDAVPDGTVTVHELVANDPPTTRALWGMLTDLDLMARTEACSLPWDDPLFALLEDPRAVAARLGDRLHLRLLDVPEALSARRYATGVELVLEVSDAQVPTNAGRWRLTGGPDAARVEPAAGHADLRLDVRALGSVYAGGFPVASLAEAGLIEELTPGAVDKLAAALSYPRLPWTSHGF